MLILMLRSVFFTLDSLAIAVRLPVRLLCWLISICAVQFSIQYWTPHVAAYIFGLRIVYAHIVSVQFSIHYWTPPISAYIFGLRIVYAHIVSVQFSIQYWTPHIVAYIFGLQIMYAEGENTFSDDCDVLYYFAETISKRSCRVSESKRSEASRLTPHS